jgi:hypothetical protein
MARPDGIDPACPERLCDTNEPALCSACRFECTASLRFGASERPGIRSDRRITGAAGRFRLHTRYRLAYTSASTLIAPHVTRAPSPPSGPGSLE